MRHSELLVKNCLDQLISAKQYQASVKVLERAKNTIPEDMYDEYYSRIHTYIQKTAQLEHNRRNYFGNGSYNE